MALQIFFQYSLNFIESATKMLYHIVPKPFSLETAGTILVENMSNLVAWAFGGLRILNKIYL